MEIPGFSPIRERQAGIFVIDDHPLMREGLAKVVELEPDMQVTGETGQARGAVDRLLDAKPDAVLLDLSLKDGNGLELIKDIRAAGISAPILVLSMHDESLYAERALKAGANGYLMKDEATDQVVEGLRLVLSGEVYLSPRMNRLLLKRLSGGRGSADQDHGVTRLTDRELEILELIGRGQPSGAIAQTLGISPRTVGAHRSNIREKLGLASGSEVVRYAVQWVDAEMPDSFRP
ncbi:transcriptional regulatory protein DegU [Haloferula sargassicola]|uniref:Transcriptional regulatory protein DegU n=2 Tax=Haloferula sargassicola TaxID=490096 RepID=A0ABP9USS7_9BACT